MLIPPDILELERKPRPLLNVSLPDTQSLPPHLLAQVSFHLVAGEEDGVAVSIEERERVVCYDNPLDGGLADAADLLVRMQSGGGTSEILLRYEKEPVREVFG